ncbi:MAG: glycosyltransferase, partial [Endomicrobium sp.]|nr:glycosyltransferase [Endomicrobium sp.]
NLPVVLIKNKYGRGALNAIKTGLESSQEKYTVVTMADLSDPPSVINDMYEKAEKENADIVCASRYMKGGSQKGGPFIKSLMSRLAGVSLHLFARVPTYDSTNSFKLYRTSFLKKQTIESSGGFELGLELVAKAYAGKAKIAEVPTAWTDRAAGKSNFKVAAWTPKYLKWYFYAFKGLFVNHKKITLTLAVLILAAPAVRCFIFIRQFGVNVLWADEWELPALFENVKNCGLQFGVLFQQHNEHRIFFPKLLHIANMLLFDYDSKIGMYCSYVFLLSSWLLILKYISGFKTGAGFKFITALAVSLLCFNLRQFENILWAFQSAWILVFLCLLSSAYLFHKGLQKTNDVYILMSAIIAVIASFSSAQGLFIWFAFMSIFFLMFLSGEKFSRNHFIIIAVAAVIVFSAYFYDFTPRTHNTGSAAGKGFMFYADAYSRTLYGAVSSSYGFILTVLSCVLTILSISAVVYLARTRKIKENIFALALMFTGYIFIFSIIFARSHIRASAVSVSRYVTFTQLCYLGLILIMYRNISFSLRKYALAALIFFIAVFEFIQPYQLREGQKWADSRAYIALMVKNYKTTYKNMQGSDIGQRRRWDAEHTSSQIYIIDKNKWSVFSDRYANCNYKKYFSGADDADIRYLSF